MKKSIIIVSGGLDSITALWFLRANGYDVDGVSFNYGQRHKKELKMAQELLAKEGIRHDLVDLQSITQLLGEGGSSLVSSVEVPEGHYAEDNMKATVVPNRNMIMLSIAAGIAVAREASHVITGVHSGDHFIYPDCRPAFIDTVSQAIDLGNEGFGAEDGTNVLAPFMYYTKAEIARQAILLGVPIEKTWSCYKGEEIHCGKCGTCVERLEAIHEAIDMLVDEGNPAVYQKRTESTPENEYPPVKKYTDIDKTKYADTKFWQKAVAKAGK